MANIPLQFASIQQSKIAYRLRKGNKVPGLVWLSGYRSDMLGNKAVVVDEFAAHHGLSALRFDYSGHGESGGDFFQGTISRWLNESLNMYEKFCHGPQILVGSSMGGWIALRMAQELRKKNINLAGIVLIAPAPDFTQELLEPKINNEQRQALDDQGYFEVPSAYSDTATPFTKKLIEDGRNNLVMQQPIMLGCGIHILQGMKDVDVPYSHALKLLEYLPQDNVTLTLIRDGDHRLSRPQDLASMESALSQLLAQKRSA